jgi:hypothetical protein
MRHRWLRALTVTLMAAAVLLGSSLPVLAKPAEHFFDEGSFSLDIDCGDGLVLELDGTFQEHVLIIDRGKDRVPHFQANVSRTLIFTNPANGKTFTESQRFVDKDQSVTDNGDGTFNVVILLAGRILFHGPDGKLLFVDAGQQVLETVWADDGDFPSDGTFLGGELVKAVGRADTADRDFCEDMHELLG